MKNSKSPPGALRRDEACIDLVVAFFGPTEDRLTAPIVALHARAWQAWLSPEKIRGEYADDVVVNASIEEGSASGRGQGAACHLHRCVQRGWSDGSPDADPEMEDREKRPNTPHFGSRHLSSDVWIAEQERMEQKRHRAGNQHGKKEGDLVVLDDHDQSPDDGHIVQ
jgi:hypothetical protein